jgi:hypothetical protein
MKKKRRSKKKTFVRVGANSNSNQEKCAKFCKENKNCIEICDNIYQQVDDTIMKNKTKKQFFDEPMNICKNNKTRKQIKKELHILKKQILHCNKHLEKTIRETIKNNKNPRNNRPKSISHARAIRKRMSKNLDSILQALSNETK